MSEQNEQQKRPRQKTYRAKRVERFTVELYPTDQDIKERIADRVEYGEPRSTYIKRLIREDIEENGWCGNLIE